MAWIRGTAWHRGLSQRSALHVGSRSGPAGWKRLCGFARELCGLLGSRKPLAGVRHGEGRLLCAYHTQRDTSRAPAWMTWGAPFFTITSLSPGGCSRCFVAVTGAEGKGCGPVNWHTPVCAGGGCWHPSAHRATSWNHPESLRATRNDRNVWQLGSNCGFCEPGRGGRRLGHGPGQGSIQSGSACRLRPHVPGQGHCRGHVTRAAPGSLSWTGDGSLKFFIILSLD